MIVLTPFLGWRNTSIFFVTVTSLYLLEQMWPLVGLALFVGFSLTLGMGHGALDVVLLLAQFKPRSRGMLVALTYLMVTLVAGWLLSYSFIWAFVFLLVMSVWHFGEAYAQSLLLRLAVGGSSIMAPYLVRQATLGDLMREIVGRDISVLLDVWSGLAWAWVGLVGLVLIKTAVSRFGRASHDARTDQTPNAALVEIGVMLCLSFVLSPLLLFALYFGLFHCTTHVVRVWRATLRHQGLSKAMLVRSWSGSMMVTGILLAALWHLLPNANMSAIHLNPHVVHWLVVALGALTLPHLLLVSFSDKWLGRLG